MQAGQRIAAAGMAITGTLALVKILTGLAGHSTAVVADGMESAGDVFSSGMVLLGLTVSFKPADSNHPYGHGRAEILSGLLVGLVLASAGALICYGSFLRIGQPHEPLHWFVVWPLIASLVAKGGLATAKFQVGKRMRSAALMADALHDATDCISALSALTAVALTIVSPQRFFNADRYGGLAVGIIVIMAGVRVARETSMQLMDTMPSDKMMAEIRAAAAQVPGVMGIEKCFARKTGLSYHVDLHMEVDPEMTVRQSHQIAHDVRVRVVQEVAWVADVLVHVEPAPAREPALHPLPNR
ncbi:Cation diffusion facilitator family transporter [Candidatus Sulfopaludibacter sp. SbA4]|nr:Cation diffusion facilitator family transporter [Candidatus Sulfopaludibacter sp. SbA4]